MPPTPPPSPPLVTEIPESLADPTPVAGGVVLSSDPTLTAASALGPFDFDEVDIGRMLLVVTATIASLYALQGLSQLLSWAFRHGKHALSSDGRGEPPPPTRVLLFPRLQNMLLKVSVPVFGQAGSLACAAGDLWWHRAWGSALLVTAVGLVLQASVTVVKAWRAPPSECRIDVVTPEDEASTASATARVRLRDALFGRSNFKAVWSGPMVDRTGNLWENCMSDKVAMATSPLLLTASLFQACIAGSLAHLVRRPVLVLLIVLGLQVSSAAQIILTVPFIDPIRQRCANLSSACLVTASLLALAAPRTDATNTAIVVLKAVGIAVSASASALSIVKRVLNHETLAKRIEAMLDARRARTKTLSTETLSTRSVSIAMANPIYNDSDVLGTGEDSLSAMITSLGEDSDGHGRALSAADSNQVSVMSLFDTVDSDERSQSVDESNDDEGGEDAHEVLFGGGALALRHDTTCDNTYNPLFAMTEAAAEQQCFLDADGADGGGLRCTSEEALSLSLMRSVIAGSATALPSETDASEVRDGATPSAALAFERRVREILDAMETVEGLALSVPKDVRMKLDDGEDVHATAQAAKDAVLELSQDPYARTAVSARAAVETLLASTKELCARLGIKSGTRAADEGVGGSRATSTLDALRSMLSAAATQLNNVRLIDRDERLELAKERDERERLQREDELKVLKDKLRNVTVSRRPEGV